MDIQASHALMKICLKAALIWIVSMLLAIPEAVFSDLHPFHVKDTNQTFISCAPYPHSNELHPKIHSMASFLVFYIIPLSIISVYYYFIARNLIQSAYNLPWKAIYMSRSRWVLSVHSFSALGTWPLALILDVSDKYGV